MHPMPSPSSVSGLPDTLGERIAAIVRSIASGNNACGTLLGNDGTLNLEFIARSVRPALEVYEQEADDLRAARAMLSRESEERRQCLEYVYANAAGLLPPEVRGRLCRVIGLVRN